MAAAADMAAAVADGCASLPAIRNGARHAVGLMARGHVKDKKKLGRSPAARTRRVLVIDDHPAVLRRLHRLGNAARRENYIARARERLEALGTALHPGCSVLALRLRRGRFDLLSSRTALSWAKSCASASRTRSEPSRKAASPESPSRAVAMPMP
jgi:hypothetical protein